MLFLHGILGTRANWRGIARRFVEARPKWGAVLIDLREHGDSLGMPTPHTVRAAADDVAELARSLGTPVGGALGHSFGGKVVLEWLRSRQGLRTEAWTIDSSPSPSAANRDTTATAEVIRTLDALPRHWASREAFIAAVIEAGQPPPIAQWLAMNLRHTNDGKRTFGPELDGPWSTHCRPGVPSMSSSGAVPRCSRSRIGRASSESRSRIRLFRCTCWRVPGTGCTSMPRTRW